MSPSSIDRRSLVAGTVATGAAAAVRGGFTTVCCMPNTEPAIDDDLADIEALLRRRGIS